MKAISLPWSILDECREEAGRHYPNESGGTFMGYVHEDVIHVDHHIGPGPFARRERYRFTPDQSWQLAQIAEHYERSGRLSTYVGDWHSHPGAESGGLSDKDCGVLKRIMSTPAARCPQPVMGIMWGGPSDWMWTAWSAVLGRRRFGLGTAVEAYELHQQLTGS